MLCRIVYTRRRIRGTWKGREEEKKKPVSGHACWRLRETWPLLFLVSIRSDAATPKTTYNTSCERGEGEKNRSGSAICSPLLSYSVLSFFFSTSFFDSAATAAALCIFFIPIFPLSHVIVHIGYFSFFLVASLCCGGIEFRGDPRCSKSMLSKFRL